MTRRSKLPQVPLKIATLAHIPRYPTEVVIDGADADVGTPAGEPDDDFFSSWDKPAIKRPTPPVSRTATPPVTGRTPSPFLNSGNGKDINRSASPLSRPDTGNGAKPTAGRITSSAALRKTATGTGAKKASVLGAKKTTKLGAKKVNADAIDFDAAEKSAREEAERIEKLGYDPNAEEDKAEEGKGAAPLGASAAPISPPPSSASTSHTRQKSNAEVERLGMGMGRLGFGQIGGGKGAAASAPAKKNSGGFGSVGPVKNTGTFTQSILEYQANALTEESDDFARSKFGTQKGISSDEYFGRGNFDSNAQSEAKGRLQGFEGATSISSNAYFGRPEDEDPSDEYGDLEGAAKDFVRKFGITAGDDLENLSNIVGEGATKLQGAIRAYLGS